MNGRYRRWLASVVTVLGVLLGLVGGLATEVTPVPEKYRQWWAIALALAIALIGAEIYRVRSERRTGPSDAPDRAVAADRLSEAVRRQWQREEDQRRINDPIPLPVRWRAASDDLVDHWANIRKTEIGASAGPIAVAGRLDQIAAVYRRIPSGRLVITGPAGAGKTVLAARLALDLLAVRSSGEPVPILVSVASWNPATTSLNDWLAGQLRRDHPGLAPAALGGPDLATELIEAQLVLPILDGFDEIPGPLQRAALRRLSIADRPLVLTSRTSEYAAAVSRADVLTAAACIEIAELTVEDLAAYLPRTTRRRSEHAGRTVDLWEPILTRLRTCPGEPDSAALREALSTPLMVYLACAAYSDSPGRDPVELLGRSRAAIEEHLLSVYLPAVYQDAPAPEESLRGLTHLARHLDRSGIVNIAWWELRDTIPRLARVLVGTVVGGVLGLMAGSVTGGPVVGVTVGATATLAVALAFGLTPARSTVLPPRAVTTRLTFGLGLGLVFGTAGGFIGGLVEGSGAGTAADVTLGLRYGLAFGLAIWLTFRLSGGLAPSRSRVRVRGQLRVVGFRIARGLAFGITFGATFGCAYRFTDDFAYGLIAVPDSARTGGMAFGLAFGLGYGLAVGLAEALESSIDVATEANPTDSLADDRRNTVRRVLTGGFSFGFAFGLTGLLGFSVPGGLTLGVAVAGGLTVGLASAWGQWLFLVRLWLPLSGALPWRVHSFLTDAHRRGVLRQAGAVYQFRHARLQEYLLADH